MNQRGTRRSGQFIGVIGGIAHAVAPEDDPCAQLFGIGDFHQRCRNGHDDRRVDPQSGSVPGHGLRMVACGCRDDAGRFLRVVQREQLVESAAVLERGGVLQVFELQPDFRAADFRQCPGVDKRRTDDPVRDAVMGGVDICRGYGHWAGVSVRTPIAPCNASSRDFGIFMYWPSRQASMLSS